MKLVMEGDGFFEEERFLRLVTIHQTPDVGTGAPPVFYSPQIPYQTLYRENHVNVQGIRRVNDDRGPSQHKTWLITEEEYRRWSAWTRREGYLLRRVFCEGEPIDFAPVAKVGY